jgi:hypothetical protein
MCLKNERKNKINSFVCVKGTPEEASILLLVSRHFTYRMKRRVRDQGKGIVNG